MTWKDSKNKNKPCHNLNIHPNSKPWMANLRGTRFAAETCAKIIKDNLKFFLHAANQQKRNFWDEKLLGMGRGGVEEGGK